MSEHHGTLYQCGDIQANTLLHAKKHDYTIASLLGRKDQIASLFENGHYYCFYLAPHDYHRVHMPTSGQLLTMRYIPGRLFSVNQSTAEHVPNLFARNERVVNIFKGECGYFCVILVGAMIVGSMNTAWAGKVAPSEETPPIEDIHYDKSKILLNKADEVGFFSLGSTAILLFEKNIQRHPSLSTNEAVRMGQMIGMF